MLYLLLFGTAIIYDILVVLWYRAMQVEAIIKASLYAPLMVLIANFEAKSFVYDNYSLIPLCLGTSIGTVIGWKIGKYIKGSVSRPVVS